MTPRSGARYRQPAERHAAAFVQHLAAAFPDDYGKLMLGMPLSAEGIAMLALIGDYIFETQRQLDEFTRDQPIAGSQPETR